MKWTHGKPRRLSEAAKTTLAYLVAVGWLLVAGCVIRRFEPANLADSLWLAAGLVVSVVALTIAARGLEAENGAEGR